MKNSCARLSLTTFALALSFIAIGCGGSKPDIGQTVASAASGGGSVAGQAFKGPISGATINVFAVASNGGNGSQLGTCTTDSSGNFTCTITGANGAARACATGGTYTSEFDGSTVTSTSTICALMDSVPSGGVKGLVIDAVTDFINSLAAGQMSTGSSETAAHASATTTIDNLYGLTPTAMPETLVPMFTKASITSNPDNYKIGLVLSTIALEGSTGVAHSAKPGSAPKLGGSTTKGTSPDDLEGALSKDISDGKWDGKSFGKDISLGSGNLSATGGTTDFTSSLGSCVTNCTSVTSNGISSTDLNGIVGQIEGGVSSCSCTPAATGLNASSSGAISTLALNSRQYLFVAARENGVEVIDITDPTAASPLAKAWPAVSSSTFGGAPVGGVIPVVGFANHPQLLVFAYDNGQGTPQQVALLNINTLINGTPGTDNPVDTTVLLPLKNPSFGFSGGDAFIAGGIPAGGKIWLDTVDGYASFELATDTLDTGADTGSGGLYTIEDPNQVIAENMGADLSHNYLLAGNYGGIQIVDLAQHKSFYMHVCLTADPNTGNCTDPVGTSVLSMFQGLCIGCGTSSNDIIDGDSVDTVYQVGIFTPEDSNVVGLMNMASITKTVSTNPQTLNSFTVPANGFAQVTLSSPQAFGPTISGSAVDPGTHLVLGMAGFSDDIFIAQIQNPATSPWQGFTDWSFYTLTNSSGFGANAHDPHAVGVVESLGLGNAATTGLAYGYLLQGTDNEPNHFAVAQIDLAGFLAIARQGTSGDGAHQPNVDPATAINPVTGAPVMRNYIF